MSNLEVLSTKFISNHGPLLAKIYVNKKLFRGPSISKEIKHTNIITKEHEFKSKVNNKSKERLPN